MNKILVTGGAGFIASSLAEKLIERDDNFVVIVDNLSTGRIEKLPSAKYKNWKFIKCDVNNYNDIAEVMLAWEFDYVFHYAAVVGVQRTLNNPVLVLRDLHGIENILKLSKNIGVKRVFYSSSSEVYGEPVEFPQNESTTPLNSRLPYAIVKNAGEAFIKAYQKEFGLDFTIFRLFNTYGPKQSADFVISRYISLATQNQPITVYGDGSQSRTFCYIDDNIDAVYNAFTTSKFTNDILNIGTDYEIPILDLAKTIIKLSKSKSKIVFKPPLEEGDMTRRLPDVTKMHELLIRKPLMLEEGLKKVLENPLFMSIK
ncbi:MAG: NAD-dependent epimerase/dehydratase family protein [Bacteroidetes bacterium]|nr:NAD-dependent epimerase/dehydratase family protein [Bacteroidota bacterium]MBU1717719.1 NAD-dependent epimerase/dehydratase family protein [Bacteroidota bacterium]